MMAVARLRFAWLCAVLVGASAGPAQATEPEVLRAAFAVARTQSTQDTFGRPVYLQSVEASNRMQGEVYALVDHAYAEVRGALVQADQWCAILILQLNVQYCRASPSDAGAVLDAGIGRKLEQPLSEVYWVRFDHKVQRDADDYLAVALRAASGPMSTSDYRIVVEAMPFAQRQTLLHFSYGYSFGVAARWAIQAYLATIANDKVGFSIVGLRDDGQPIRATGMRGVLERNTMRYFLAIEARLGTLALPPALQRQQSLQDWFSATERYPRQLHEMDRDTYVAMKLRAIQRQATTAPPKHDP